ncbi:hypothetical protein CMU11_06495 [Elizabethkingia anophelis]|uniref:sensor histidine kinase n=1 Tax=Elizabethkingia anophelis TaxID=1117645 RepID=UPI000DD83D6C|nr:sensor histidine kinase [Elizabethkingia anophelis]MCT3639106.1 ATP-binding protein [Elizabethkingia anophelis]MDV3610898.1 hypothetical protein [Elizabethkingia anophelis]MDV3697943.1 hypothetical protein [Elizabethkingia anophelis]MDV3736753.1 hypothetical protein [Elizabethkingia anophelis]MDV3946680.1 hypothetical protein [Elizabethkingia anophelis]
MSDLSINNDGKDIISTLSFKPRARLLLQLGDQLIKNESIALTELVKNSYDADANKVSIYMENVDSSDNGVIIIEDDGFGMTPEIVENVWLEPGSDFKSQYIIENKTTPKYKRLPIGEKGIGRFGVHKLGNVIELTTKSSNEKEVYVHIDWSNFNNYKYLSDVPIKVVIRHQPQFFTDGKTGTNIVISDLRKTWERGIAREVKRSINSLSSPFNKKDSFHTEFEILDKPGWFEDLVEWKDIKEYSLFYFKIKMKEQQIVSFEYKFTPWNTMSKLFPKEIDLDDKLLETEKILKRGDKNNKETINLSRNKIGEVEFEGYIFDLDSFILKLGVSDKAGFRKYLKSNGGIKVFRDGLRVYDYGEPENDWLGLDYRRFQNPTKAISNNLIIGSISLNRAESTDLVEKTNREGFVENEAYSDFKNAILHCLDVVESIRQIDKKKLKDIYGPTPKSAPLSSTIAEAKIFIEEKIRDTEVKNKILHYFTKIETDYKRVSDNLIKAAGAGLSMSVVVHEVEKILYEVIKVLNAEKASDRVLDLVTHLSKLIDGYAEIIRKSDQVNLPISKTINQALFNTEYRLNAHKIEVIKDYNNFIGNQTIKISKNLVLGTLINIIDNSIYWLDQKYISSKINNQSFEKKIFISLEEDNNSVSIIIADNGSGFSIPTEDITEPFVSARPGGMGLGLHIASEIMEAHKGAIMFPEFGDVEIPEEFRNGAIVKLNFSK